jgi:N,N'-diacetyllegionaminate synthase
MRARAAGCRALALLHCVSSYPVPAGSENLLAIQTLARTFGVPVGLSDHGADVSAVPIAVTLGASMYERHLMLDGDEGVDAAVSSSPDQLGEAIRSASRTLAALGHGRKECLAAEAMNLIPSRRGLYASRALRAGHVLLPADVCSLRPLLGMSPACDVVGLVLIRDVAAGAPLVDRDLEARSDRGAA